MVLNVNNKQADELTRKFADIAGVGITDAIVIAMTEAIERRRKSETPLQTVERLKKKYLIPNDATAPLPRAVYDAMWRDEQAEE